MEAGREQLDSKQDRLVEIYKLQSQLANGISNRRTTTHRFYILLMSGLTLIVSAFLQNKDKLPTELLGIVSFEHFILIGLVLGISLSWSWLISINSNLRLNSRKYKALMKLENELEYQFFKNEWEFLGKYRKGKTYWQLSIIEITVPTTLFLLFTFLLGLVAHKLPNRLYLLCLMYPGILIILFLTDCLEWLEVDMEKNKHPGTNSKKRTN